MSNYNRGLLEHVLTSYIIINSKIFLFENLTYLLKQKLILLLKYHDNIKYVLKTAMVTNNLFIQLYSQLKWLFIISSKYLLTLLGIEQEKQVSDFLRY